MHSYGCSIIQMLKTKCQLRLEDSFRMQVTSLTSLAMLGEFLLGGSTWSMEKVLSVQERNWTAFCLIPMCVAPMGRGQGWNRVWGPLLIWVLRCAAQTVSNPDPGRLRRTWRSTRFEEKWQWKTPFSRQAVCKRGQQQEWSMSNFPCSLTRNITSHSMKNMAFHACSGERWSYTNSHCPTYTFISV